MDLFDSLNIYENLEYLEALSLPDLLVQLKQIKRPIKLINIVTHGSKVYAVFLTDVKIKRTKKGE